MLSVYIVRRCVLMCICAKVQSVEIVRRCVFMVTNCTNYTFTLCAVPRSAQQGGPPYCQTNICKKSSTMQTSSTTIIIITITNLIISSRIKRDSPSGDDRQVDVAQDGAFCLAVITQLLGKSRLSFIHMHLHVNSLCYFLITLFAFL